MTRRDFAIASLAGAMRPAQAQTGPRLTKGICSIIFPKTVPRAEAFEQAKKAGFDAIELALGHDLDLDTAPDGSLYVLDIGGSIYRISYTGTSNREPTAIATADKTDGPLPLTVNFNGELGRYCR